jgi:uncharacterized membrane protein
MVREVGMTWVFIALDVITVGAAGVAVYYAVSAGRSARRAREARHGR